MATIYSDASWTGQYTYTRVKVDYDYSKTRATATLLYTRTNNYSGATYAGNATFTFGDGSVVFDKTFYGKQTDAVVASLTFNYSLSGGTYSGSSNGDFLGGSWSVTIPAAPIWNNINAYQPDGTTENGLIFDLKTSDGGSWTNLTNEPENFTKAKGTTATISNIRPNVTGAHYTTNSVTNTNASSFTWTFNSANYAVNLYSAWNTYYRDINAWQPGATAQGGLLFDYYIYDRNGNLVNAYYNVTNEVAGTVTREYGYTGKINNIRPNITGAHYTSNNVTNNGAGEFTWTYDNTNSIDLYSAWNTHTITIRRGTGISDITSPAWGWTNNYKTGTVTYGQSFNINVSLATGYHWVNWTGSFTTTTQNYTFTIGDQNYDLTANGAPNTYTIRYNANGGSGSMSDTGATYDSNVTLRANSFSRSGYSFAGWATSSGGSKAYNNQQTVSNLTTTNGGVVTLYAVWTLNAPSAASHTIKYSTRSKIGISVSGGGAEISNYTVYYRANSTGSYSSLNLGTGTTGTITGLSPNTTYQIFVRVTNAAGSKDSTASIHNTIAYIPNSLSVSVSNTLPFTTDLSVTGNGDINAGITNRTVYCCTKPNKPIYDMAIKTLPDGSLWARIFYHNVKESTVLFSSVSEARNIQTADKYSRLYLLDDDTYKGSDGKFEFMLCYPNDTTQYNRWKQTNNPCSIYTGGGAGTFVPGYEAIHIDWAGENWGGLERNSSDTYSIRFTYLDGSVGFDNWWYAIAPTEVFDYGMPGPGVTTSSIVEVWVRIGSTNILTKDLGTSTTGTLTGLAEETEYIIWTGTSNAYGTNYSAATSFTTPADQAKIRIKQNGQWQKGKAYYKKDGQWIKAKKIYIKVNGQWKINNNYDN